MCPTQFQTYLVFLELPDGIFCGKIEVLQVRSHTHKQSPNFHREVPFLK